MEGSLNARAGSRVKRYDHVAKSKLRQNFAKVAKILRLSQKYWKTVEKTFRLILCLFGFVKATKFRDSREYS